MTPYSRYETVPDLLAARAGEQGGRTAVTISGRDLSYGQMWERAGRVAAWLVDSGVRRGDHVALLMRNSLSFLDAWLGLSRLGAVAVPINTATVGEALRHTLLHSRAEGVLADPDLLAAVEALGPLPALRWQVGGQTPFSELLEHSHPAPAAPVLTGEDPMNIIYTSGTTGLPKGVVLSHTSYVNTGGYFGHHLGLSAEDVLHTCLPLFHCNAQQCSLMAALMLGARVAIDPRFSLSGFWPAIHASGATVSNPLGAMLALLSKQQPSELERDNPLRYMVAAPVPESLHRDLEQRFGVRIVEGYGLTETGTMACINPPDDRRSGTIGRPLEHNELRVVDERDVDVPIGVKGELITRSRIPGAFMSGYFDEPEQTAQVMRGGWLHTGDAVYQREDGYFVFVDRIKDTIRRRGENISSFLVEKAVLDHPEVLEVAAVGVASELSEQDVLVVVVRRPGSRLTAEELVTESDPRLSDFMRARYVRFVDSLPRTETGRVHKYLLREDGPAGAWDRERARSVHP